MARDRERILAEESLGGNRWLVTKLRYDLGGQNYFSGNREPRGYFVCVTPETRENGSTSWTLFSGVKDLVQQAKSFSAKTLAEITVPAEHLEKLRQHVLAKEKEKMTA